MTDTAHDFALFFGEGFKPCWKCIYCSLVVETLEEVFEHADEPCGGSEGDGHMTGEHPSATPV